MPGRKYLRKLVGTTVVELGFEGVQPAAEARLHVGEEADGEGDGGAKSVKPMNVCDTRLVATYSIATNRLKKSSDVPRSRWRNEGRDADEPDDRMMGPRSRARGRRMPRICCRHREIVAAASGEEYGVA